MYPRNSAGIGASGIAALNRQCCADELCRGRCREPHRQAGRRIRRRQHVARRGRLLDWRPPWPSTLLAVRHHPRILPGSTRMERMSHWAASSVRYVSPRRSARSGSLCSKRPGSGRCCPNHSWPHCVGRPSAPQRLRRFPRRLTVSHRAWRRTSRPSVGVNERRNSEQQRTGHRVFPAGMSVLHIAASWPAAVRHSVHRSEHLGRPSCSCVCSISGAR